MGLADWLMCNHVLDDAVRQTPLDEIELGDGGCQPLKLNTFGPAKRVEQFFRVSIETRFVGDVHGKGATGLTDLVRDVAILCVIGDEPLQITQ